MASQQDHKRELDHIPFPEVLAVLSDNCSDVVEEHGLRIYAEHRDRKKSDRDVNSTSQNKPVAINREVGLVGLVLKAAINGVDVLLVTVGDESDGDCADNSADSVVWFVDLFAETAARY